MRIFSACAPVWGPSLAHEHAWGVHEPSELQTPILRCARRNFEPSCTHALHAHPHVRYERPRRRSVTFRRNQAAQGVLALRHESDSTTHGVVQLALLTGSSARPKTTQITPNYPNFAHDGRLILPFGKRHCVKELCISIERAYVGRTRLHCQ